MLQHTINMFWDTLYDIKRKKYKIVCAELLLVKVTMDTQGLLLPVTKFASLMFFDYQCITSLVGNTLIVKKISGANLMIGSKSLCSTE